MITFQSDGHLNRELDLEAFFVFSFLFENLFFGRFVFTEIRSVAQLRLIASYFSTEKLFLLLVPRLL